MLFYFCFFLAMSPCFSEKLFGVIEKHFPIVQTLFLDYLRKLQMKNINITNGCLIYPSEKSFSLLEEHEASSIFYNESFNWRSIQYKIMNTFFVSLSRIFSHFGWGLGVLQQLQRNKKCPIGFILCKDLFWTLLSLFGKKESVSMSIRCWVTFLVCIIFDKVI